METVTFNNGVKVPIVGLGTYAAEFDEVIQAVKDAIDAGYRHFDTAYFYKNEREIGLAIAEKIAEGAVKREDLFVTSKLWNNFHKPDQVERAFEMTRKNLGLDYVDLYLVHWPMGSEDDDVTFSDVDYVETWLALEKIHKKGLVKSIGVSNFNKSQIERILEHGSVLPVTNQIECHPYLNQRKLIEFCKSKNITVTAYTPLGRFDQLPGRPELPVLVEHPIIKQISAKLNKSPAQILIKYQVQRGVIAIPKSANKTRLIENIQVFDFVIPEEDLGKLNMLDVKGRFIPFPEFAAHKFFPFHDEY